ncbi:uncharacterized protein MYCFIDRAFT_195521 [Pseudocercospora fijiensis CIRAD86]|uniref:Uncharacterized protein n=1 Tax=Pseudocercospora fijiensis (strain CIRAD86) TaxID=383855 RepID=M3B556_PSEFD|nr:uncharacterized protein MYCFIDRAFT_195521 [Pseudocercospora fijiensis CIRAD86]EME84487.1 hypothetical protein MYCFIDRAFT_195521 [Pseudocercospora fijiensis CIRAD86]
MAENPVGRARQYRLKQMVQNSQGKDLEDIMSASDMTRESPTTTHPHHSLPDHQDRLQLANTITVVASIRALAWPVDMDCNSTKMRGVGASDGLREAAEEYPAKAATETELVLAIEDATGLGEHGLIETKEGQSDFCSLSHLLQR